MPAQMGDETMQILWQRRFGPFDPRQAIEMRAELRKVKATDIQLLSLENGRFVSAVVPMSKVDRVVEFAAKLQC